MPQISTITIPYMKSTALKYGTLSGLITAAIMLASTLYEKKNGFESTPSIVGFVGIILVFLPLYLGIKKYRDTDGGGYLTFWKGLNIGVSIIVISGIFYAITKLMIFYWITPDYPDQYSVYIVHQIKLSGKDLADTALAKQQMVQLKEMTKNPFIFGAISFTQPLLLELVMTFLCAAILRKKPPTVEITNLN